MNKINKYMKAGLLICCISLVLISCEKWIDLDVNKDPDNPENISPANILPGVEAQLAYKYGGFDAAGVIAMWLQDIQGIQLQAKEINDYQFEGKDVENLWNGFYRGVLEDLQQMITMCENPETYSPFLLGISKTLMAFTYGVVTQLWGDIPMTEALQGSENLYPKYDTQEQVYKNIQLMLDEALVELKKLDTTKNFYKIQDDFIFPVTDADNPNNKLNWIKVANSLKMRYYLHLTKKNSSYYQTILDFKNKVTEDSILWDTDDEFRFFFGETSTFANPMWQFERERGFISRTAKIADSLKNYKGGGLDDPRIQAYTGGTSVVGDFYGQQNSPVVFMSVAEVRYILAECEAKTGNYTDAKSLLEGAILASIEAFTDFLDVDESVVNQWLRGGINSVGIALGDGLDSIFIKGITDDELYNVIMVNKSVSMFLQPEYFVDWRRTGIPELSPRKGASVPRRFPYPQSERLYNTANIPSGTSIFTKNWFEQ